MKKKEVEVLRRSRLAYGWYQNWRNQKRTVSKWTV